MDVGDFHILLEGGSPAVVCCVDNLRIHVEFNKGSETALDPQTGDVDDDVVASVWSGK